ncbi:MAG: hypothetical protein QM775_15535 [Pirellulales bacterium]
MFPIQVETVALVTGLPGTGSDPAPSPQRSFVMQEMQRNGVEKPNQILASPNTDIVMVRGYLRPAFKRGTSSIWKFAYPRVAKIPGFAAAGSCNRGSRNWLRSAATS